MKLKLRPSVIAFVLLLLSARINAQTVSRPVDCPGVPGACGYTASASALHSGPNPTPQNGNNTLGNIYTNTACGLDYAITARVLGKRFSPQGANQPAAFTISGIPAGACILKAYLWAEGSGDGTAQTATIVNPSSVTTNYPMTIVGQGPDKCWSYAGSYTYRADVTASIAGNGNYNISGLLTNPPTSGNDMDGAALMVIWSDASQTWRGTVRVDDGAYVVNGGVANYVMTYPAVCGTTTNASAFMCIGDIQMTPTSWTLNGTAAPLTWNWWDLLKVNTPVASGQTTSAFNINTGGDCFNLCVAGLYYRTTCIACTPAVLNMSSTPATCSGCNGTATVSVNPAGTYTYNWSPSGGTGATATGLCAGTYTVTVSSGCNTYTASVVVANAGGGLTVTGTQTNVLCNGGCTATATSTVTGGTAPYTFVWSPAHASTTSGNTNTASALCAGTYTVTVTDASGCTGNRVITITQPPALTATQSQVNILCNGSCNGTATVVASGGTPGYTYSWAPSGGTGATASSLCTGTYTCTITDANGCSITKTFSITQPPALTATQSQVNILCNGGTGSATVVASGGTPGYTYSWAPSGGTGATATGLGVGTYTCTITDANGCTITKSFTITSPPALTATQSQVNILCNGVCNGSATVVASGGTPGYTYAWTPTGGTAATTTGRCAGNYTCTITDANGCSITKTFNITQPTLVTATQSQVNVSCNGGTNGSATVVASGGTPGYTYSWAPSGGTGATATGLSANSYTCTITDANGCSITKTFTITQPTPITATTATTTATCGNPNGTATVTPSGGTPGYTYSWAPSGGTGATATGLAANSYTCTITDANGCSITKTVSIINAGSPTATISASTNILCNGGNNGSATVTASGGVPGYTYAWAPSGGTGATATGLIAGNYTVTVTDANGCTATATVALTQPPALAASATSTPVLCNGGNTGTATVTASGGTPGYTYLWTPSGGTGSTATGLTATTYTCVVTDANGCTRTATTTVTQPTAVTATISSTPVLCNGGNTGTATVVASGGTPGYTYSWAPSGGTGPGASGLAATTYTCTITDANGCSITASVTVTQPTAISLTTSFVQSTCGNANGQADVISTGGTPGYTYSWAPSGGTGSTATGLSAQGYTVTVTDANGCISTASVNVPNAGSPTAVISASTNVSCFGGNNGSATVTGSGGNPLYTYSWAPSGGTGQTGTNLIAGSYTVTLTDANGCTATASVVITEPPVLTATASSTPVVCNGGSTGSATVVASGGVTNYSYSWAPLGGTNQVAPNLITGSYTCTVTDANGCTTTASTTVTQPTLLTATSTQIDESCNGGNTASATVTPAGGIPGYTYSWAPTGGSNATATGLLAISYTCTITDANGCITTASLTITQPTAISLTTSFVQSTCGNANGQADVISTGGTPGYTYSWSPTGGTGSTATGLSAQGYTVTVTDSKGCTATASVNVPNAGSPIATITASTNVLCFGGNNGDATVTVTGAGTPPYTYAWSPTGGTGATGTGLIAGSYIVTVTDTNGCSAVDSVIITEPPVLTATASSMPVLCFAGGTGNATVLATGGVTSYTYAWSPMGGTNQVAPNLVAGSYTCTVTDANGCTTTATTSVTQPPLLITASSQVNELCFGGNNASATVIPSGGTPTYTYAWLPSGGTNATATSLTAGTYTCTVTDANNCITTQSFTITQPTQFVVSAVSVDAHCNQADGSASATATGGTGSPSFAWSLPAIGDSINNVVAGTYTVIATDANGCMDTTSVTVNNLNGVNASLASLTNVGCFAQATGQIVITQTGGNPAYTYNWTPNISTTDTASGLAAGNYQVIVSDANGCTSTVSVTVTEPPLLTIMASAVPSAVCSGTSVTLNSTPAGGAPALTVVWTPGSLTGNSQTLVPTASTTYTATVTDANGCTAVATTNVTVYPMPTAVLVGDLLSGCAPICVNFSDLSTVAAPGVITAWDWDFGDGNTSTLQNPTNHCYQNPGLYTIILTVKTADGCTNTITMPNYINVFANPVAAFGASPQPTTMLDPQVFFTDSSTNASTWMWSFGDFNNSSSSLQNPSFTYTEPDCYTVLLTVTSPQGCIDSISHPICIGPEATIYVPNAFTPNGDGTNETFFPVALGIDPDQFEMWIFDRWGNMIFYTDDINKGWDGRVQGGSEIAQIDTYVWKIKAVDIVGTKHNLVGRVTIVK